MSEVVITAIITGVLTYLATQVEASYRFKEKGVESGAKTEGIYVENMTTILAEYKEQVSSFRDEVKMLREENQDIKRQLNDLQKERKEIIDKFNEERTYYERELELKDEIIDGLQEENEDLKQEIIILKEDK